MKSSIKLIIFLTLIFSFQVFAEISTNIQMKVGTLDLLPIDNVTRIAVAQQGIVSAKVIDNESVLLIAEGPGQTQLQIWDLNNNSIKLDVAVNSFDTSGLTNRVKTLIADIPSLSVRQVGG
ncbi:pilus assembly protein N-terminal domain-containing protein [Pseudoalteromonas sp. B137]